MNFERRAFSAAAAAALLVPAGRLRAQSTFKLQTPTALAPTPQGWSFVVFGNGDVGAINRHGSQGRIQVHILAAGDNYQRFALQVESAIAAGDENWDFVALPNRDIAAVNRRGASGMTEVHVLDGSRKYGAFKLQTPTPLPPGDRRWSFGANGDGDLVGINRLGASGGTEIHILDAGRKFGAIKLQTGTVLRATDSTWDFGVLGSGDVVAISRRGSTGKPELLVLDAASAYQSFKLQLQSPLQSVDESWKFAVRSNGDVFAVLTAGSASGKTELHVFGSVKVDRAASGK